jgi:phosphoglycolate phosphatase
MARSVLNIIFDVDGTLIDSKRDIAGAQLWVLKQLGINSLSEEDLYPHIGKPLAETFSLLLPDYLHSRIPEAAVMYRDYYRPRALNTTTLFPGVRETIEILAIRKIKLATATTKSSETTARVLNHFSIAEYFVQMQGTDNGIFKPDPYVLNKVIHDQQWEISETMMVGDTDRDILAGKNAGLRTCGVTYGSFTKSRMNEIQPDWVIDSFPQLLSIV